MSDIGGAGGEDLPDLVSHIVVDPDLAGNTARIEKLTAAQVDQLKRAAKRWAEINEKANAEMQRQTREHLKKIIDIRRGAAREEQRLALTAGSEAGKLERAKGQEIVKAQRASQEVAERELKRHYAFNVKTRSRFFDDALRALNAGAKKERDARQHADAQDRQDQERQHKWSHYQERAYWSALGKLWDHFLKERRRKARAADFERLADQKHEHRTAYVEQVHQNALDRAREKGHQDRLTAMSRSFWSSMRSLTETGGRFVSSISQSFLRSMGNAFAEGFRRITGTYRRGTDMNERVLRDSLSDQQRAVTVALARQEGAYAAFQQTAQRGALGGILNARNALLGLGGLGGFLSARAIFGPVMDFQKYQVSFEALLGSAERAGAFLNQLRQFSANTPFDLSAITESSQKLLAFGFAARDVIPIMTTIGDSASALGQGQDAIAGVIRALGQMKGRGKAAAEEMNQISDALPGFSAIEAVADKMGISVAEAFDQMRAGAIPADLAIEAILEGMADMPGAAGAMDRASRTLAGRLQNLGETITKLLVDAISPFTGAMADAVGLFTSFIESLFKGKGIWAVVRSGLLGIAVALGAIAAQKGAVAVMQLLSTTLKVMAANPLTVLALSLSALASILYRHNDTFRSFVNDTLGGIRDFMESVAGPAGAALDAVTGAVSRFARVLERELGPNVAVMLRWIEKGEWAKALGSLGRILSEGFTMVMRQVWSALSGAAEFLRPFAGLLVSAVQYGFASLQVWLNGGGVGRLASMIGDALSGALDRLSGTDWTKFIGPVLAVIGAAIAYSFGGIPGLIVTALLVGSPRVRDGIGVVLVGIGRFIAEKLPPIMFKALHDAAEFLSGPVLATLLGPIGVRVIAGLVAAVIGGGVAIATGLIDGIKRSLPSVLDAVQGLANDIVSALAGTLSDVPVIGDMWRVAFLPVESLLRGIIPTISLFVDMLHLIPTPVIAAAAAILLLSRAWTAFQGSFAARTVVRVVEFFQGIPALAARAGSSLQAMGQNLINATGPAITNGAATRMQTAMGSIGVAAQGAGTAITAVGAALPMVAGVAAVALPVILGMWQSAQAAAKRHRQEIVNNAQAMLDLETTAHAVLVKMVRDSDAATRALNDMDLSVGDLEDALVGSTRTVGQFYAAFGPTGNTLGDRLRQSGITMQEFGAAVLDGDQAVRDLAYGMDKGTATGTDFMAIWNDIPEALRDAADQMAENARSMLTQAAVTGQLTQAEQDRLATILAMEHPEARLIDLQREVTARLNGTKAAADRQAETYRDLRDRIDEVANSTSIFNDVLDRLTGQALPLTRVRQNIEDALARFRDVMHDPEASPGEQARAFTDYSEAIRTSAQDLLDLHRPMNQVIAAYRLQRAEIINQRIALGDTREEARRYAEEVLGLPPVSRMRVELEDRAASDHIARIQRKMEDLGRMRPSPQVRMDLERYRLQKVALDAQLEGLSNREIAVRVNLVATVDSAFQRTIDNLLASTDPAQQRLGRQLQRNWISQLPHMAQGGIVTKPTLALIGEAGPEAVVPLSNGMGSLPLSLSFDATAIAGQVDAIAALLAPLGDRIMVATQPGMDRWKASMDAFLDGIYTGFTTWGDRMVQAGTDIGTAIAGALTSTLREGRQQVVGITRGYARSLVSALNPLLSGIGEEPITLNFARGGIAEAYQGAQVHVFNEGRRGRGSSHGEAYIPFDPANRSRSRSLTDETARRLGGEVHWYAQGGLSPDAIRRGQSFARAQAGKPYVWGGVGPNGFDCSGLASAIVNVIQNSPHPYARRFTSATLTSGGAVAGLIPGPGQVTIGARPGRPGHVTTNIAGLKAEATNGAVRVGPTAADVSGFSSLWHLGSGVFIGADGTVYPIPRVPDAGSHGWLSSTARSAMRFVRRKARSWVDANTYTGSTSALESVMNGMQSGPASPELMATIRRAMSIAGVPSSWLGPLLTLISRESSYNPRAFNRTLGASGLMQTIPSTFARYALPGYGGIFDPLANVIAGLRYILDRYGSIFNVGQAVSPSPTRGYSYGGVVDRDGIYRLAEGNRREVVLPLENKGRLMELLRRTGLDETISLALGEYPTPTKGAGATTGGATPTIGSVIGEMHVHSNSMDPATVGRIAARRTADEVRSALAGVA